MTTKYKIGDVVKLNSGSPIMTIVDIYPNKNELTKETIIMCKCAWFYGQNINELTFIESALELIV